MTNNVVVFREACAAAAKTLEEREKACDTVQEALRVLHENLKEEQSNLEAREKKLDAQLESVKNVQQIAAARKTEALVAQDQANKAHEARKKALADLKVAMEEKKRLEAVVATLVTEKAALEVKVGDLEKALNDVQSAAIAPTPISA